MGSFSVSDIDQLLGRADYGWREPGDPARLLNSGSHHRIRYVPTGPRQEKVRPGGQVADDGRLNVDARLHRFTSRIILSGGAHAGGLAARRGDVLLVAAAV